LLIVVLLNGGARLDAKGIAVSPGVRVQLESLSERACTCDERAQLLSDWGNKREKFSNESAVNIGREVATVTAA